MIQFSRVLRGGNSPSPWNNTEPVREELFGEERLAQHAHSLARAQQISNRASARPALATRLKDNAQHLLLAYEATVTAAAHDEAITPAVRASFVASARTYGARRIWRDVLEAGSSCGLHKIERLMRAQALRARPRKRALPKDDGDRSASAIAPNVLDRQFTADQPNRKWIADFTYVWTAEGWLYVAAVVDLFRAA